jgi:RNase adapter protein RapZ
VRIVLVTGLSGAGKSTALRALEDADFYCVDNLPLPLAVGLVELLTGRGITGCALSVDARQHWFLPTYRETVNQLRGAGHHVEVLFLAANDEILLRRYSETRRRHPLSGDQLQDGVHRDRQLLSELRDDATVVDTERLNVHELRTIILERYGKNGGRMAVTLQSFGYKHGLPPESDLVFDVRFLPNPYFVPALSPRDGRDAEVARYVLESAPGGRLVEELERFLRFSLPNYVREGKLYLTVAVGCTGGRHRSVAVIEELARRLGGEWDVALRHRDVGRSRPEDSRP